MKAFEDNIILRQSLGTLNITMPSLIEAYTLNPWNKTNACNNSCPDTISHSGLNESSYDSRCGTSDYTCANASTTLLQQTRVIQQLPKLKRGLPRPRARKSSAVESQTRPPSILKNEHENVLAPQPKDEIQQDLPQPYAREDLHAILLQGESMQNEE